MSGTTAISVGFHAGRMTISNVGDSRAVLGHRLEKEEVQEYVMNDSTPAEEEKKEIGEEDDDDDDPTTTNDDEPSMNSYHFAQYKTPTTNSWQE